MADEMQQVAPYPTPLAELVEKLEYRKDRGWEVRLEARDRGQGSSGLTLVVQRCGPDSYNPDQILRVNHFFIVPAAAYDMRSWRRWLFDRLGDVDTHERMEDFKFVIPGDGAQTPDFVERPYAPHHQPGADPYQIFELGTREEQRRSFTGELNPE